jgi:hypothetical protein
MTREEVTTAWDVLGDKTIATCEQVVMDAEFGDQNSKEFSVKLAAILLLCRTAHHFAAVRLLLTNKFVVEARTLARCCYENLFWIGGLTTKGPAFIEQMGADYDYRTRTLVNDLAAHDTHDLTSDPDLEAKFTAFMDELNARSKGGAISHQAEAVGADLKAGYTFYRVLSGDAAHPSARSISRHLDSTQEVLTITNQPLAIGDDEDIETFELACGALLSVCTGADMLVGGKHADELGALATEFKALSAESVDIKN